MTRNTLTPRQKHAALLLAAGESVHDVAAELDLTPQTITKYQARQDFQDEVAYQLEHLLGAIGARVTEKVLRHFDEHALSAAEEMTSLSTSAEKEAVKLAASKEVLAHSSLGLAHIAAKARARRPHPQQVEITLDAVFLQAAAQAAQELAQGMPPGIMPQPMTALTVHGGYFAHAEEPPTAPLAPPVSTKPVFVVQETPGGTG